MEETEKTEPTLERPATPATEPETSVIERPGAAAAAREFAIAHRTVLAISAALGAALIVLLVLASAHAASVPADDVIVADARTRVIAPVYDGGKWGDPDELALKDVKVKSAKRASAASDPANAQFGASAYATATVEATYENDSVRATKEATLGFAKVAGNWTAIGQEEDTSVSYEPLAGVNEAQVKANISDLLERAEQGMHDTSGAGSASGSGTDSAGADTDAGGGIGELSLAGIYADGKLEVASSDFDADAKTDVVRLHAEKDGAFDKRSCDIEATFSFRSVNGLWEITDTKVPADAKARDFSPLIGTWEGTFQTQETDGGKCLAAAEAPLVLTIAAQEGKGAVDGSGSQLTGSIDVLAHFHAQPSRDSKSADGDEALHGVALTAGYAGDTAEKGLSFTGTLPDQAGGKVDVELDFGPGGDATAAVAKVTTSHTRTSSFLFIPYSETAMYTDTYLLRRK